jgi:hypothetical protein
MDLNPCSGQCRSKANLTELWRQGPESNYIEKVEYLLTQQRSCFPAPSNHSEGSEVYQKELLQSQRVQTLH